MALCLTLSAYGQEVNQERSVQHTDSTLKSNLPQIHNISTDRIKEQAINKETYTLQADTANLTDMSHVEYWLLPWGSRDIHFKASPYAYDYESEYSWGRWQWYSLWQTIPAMGTLAYMRFLYNMEVAYRFNLLTGGFISQYSLPLLNPTDPTLNDYSLHQDFGLNFGIEYLLTPRTKIGLMYQHSFRQKIIGTNSHFVPWAPHDNLELNFRMKGKKGVNWKFGVMYDLTPQ